MPVPRRAFLATAASYSRILGANERVQVGFIGYGLIGAQHVHDFKNQKDAELAAMCEVYQPRLEQGVAACGGRAKAYRDFRKLLDDKEIQAVVVSTPDHWHALMTMMACAAGKDVYVEKPMTLFVQEGRWMTQVARRHKRVVQVGTQQRSGRHYQKARDLIRAGYIGKVHSVRMGAFRNIMPGFGSPADTAAPSGFDYDLWLGPAPKRPYNPHRGIYHFRWFWDYSGGQMTNLGAHSIDVAQWYMNAKGPRAVSSMGGRFALEDNGETPDTQDAIYQYPGWTAVWSHREAGTGSRSGSGLEFYGTKGSLTISRGGFRILADERIEPANAIPQFRGHAAGGPRRSESKPEPWLQTMQERGSSDEQFDLHVRNFLDCIRTRQQPIADVEDGHRVAAACHLGNLSLRLGRSLHWDAGKEQIPGDAEAAKMLVRPYRKPWDAVLRSLLA
ncbi:MAG: Gfo/Idh/MocA family oxidoreductase [Acidobacteria bacterium]|nr:Gfo/Idh/MocA family oxidoreductase [Acidobacteriota bacterium]MBI3279890.1 Gfo/Idh/MocA family oxidoreductase [Acidobacteriota bacterium]